MRHVIALVRIHTGLNQVEFARLVGCSPATIQKIEQGAVALSEALALRLQRKLTISAAWLFNNDPEIPALTPQGEPWVAPRNFEPKNIYARRREAILARLQAADKAYEK